MLTRPPFAAPHHDASTASLVGGGSGTVRPGEISRAHCGVLFLDEFPLFRADVINALRQPLESGDISVARGEESVVLPARAHGRPGGQPVSVRRLPSRRPPQQVHCREVQRRDYRRKVTGPITDRIDITRHLAAPTPTAKRDRFAVNESTAEVRARVEEAQGPAGRPLRRRAVAAQRSCARPCARRSLADDDRGHQARRRPALGRAPDPPRGQPRAPARVDGRRPRRRRPARGRGGRGRAAPAHRPAAVGCDRAEAAG